MATFDGFGVTPQGFNVKRLADIRASISGRLANVTDPSTGETINLNPSSDSVAQQISDIFCDSLAEAWNELLLVYNQFDPLKAEGAALRGLVQLNAIQALAGSFTVIQCSLTGTPGATIPAGSQAGDVLAETIFTLNTDVVLDTWGNGVGLFTCTRRGNVVVNVGTIINITTPRNGWSTVYNNGTLYQGIDTESDQQLRDRQQLSTANTSFRQVEAVWAGVANLDGVIFTRMYVNNTLSQDDRGIDAKSLAAVVVGGDDTEIAEELLKKAPLGIEFFGTTLVTLFDKRGGVHPVYFTRPDPTTVYLNLVLNVTNGSVFPADFVTEISTNILDYVQNGYTEEDPGFPPGESVIRTRLFTAINKTPGFEIVTLQLGLEADLSDLAEQDIAIAWNQFALFLANNMTIGTT
jgi:uncharacterized phage protein gp47/JayE